MKSIRRTIALLPFAAIVLFSACSKDEPEMKTRPEYASEIPVRRVSQRQAGTEGTTGFKTYEDTLFYNSRNQLIRVGTESNGDLPVFYSFTYNSEGYLASMRMEGANIDYYLHYADNHLDSITINGTTAKVGGKLVYNAQGELTAVNIRATSLNEMTVNTSLTYARNTSGKIDSITMEAFPEVQMVRSIHPSAATTPVRGIQQELNNAYLFLMAARESVYLFYPGLHNNMYLHHFLNPDDNTLGTGTFNDYSSNKYDQPYTIALSQYNGRLSSYSYSEGVRAPNEENEHLWFTY